MSQLLGGALPAQILERKDKRLHVDFQAIREERDRIIRRPGHDKGYSGAMSAFWPGNGGFAGADGSSVAILQPVWRSLLARLGHGVASRVGFIGVTRDQYGAPLGGVTCSLFRTSNRQWIMDIVSDANGNFLLQSWYSPDTHFIVFAKAGSPNVFGVTDQNLVGG